MGSTGHKGGLMIRHLVVFLLISPAVSLSRNEITRFASMHSVGDSKNSSGEVVNPGDKKDDDSVGIPFVAREYHSEVYIGCEQSPYQSLKIDPILETAPIDHLNLTIKGTFCPRKVDELHIVLAVDFSGSMGLHRPGKINPLFPAMILNSTRIAEECKVYKLADKVLEDKNKEDNVYVALVPFAGEVVHDFVIEFALIQQFAKRLALMMFVATSCRTIALN